MRRFLAIFLATFLSIYRLFAQGQQVKLEHLIEVYAANSGFNGTVLVIKKGTILLSKGYGYRDVERQLPNTINTIFLIGTNTEQFTTEMILSLDSKAALSLEDKLFKYFPEIPDANRISIKNLLTHTSGLADFMADSAMFKIKRSAPLRRADILETLRNKPLSFYPGTKYAYSTTDYFLAGLIIEKVARWDYEDLIREKLFQPCGMRESGIDYVSSNNDNKAIGYYSIEYNKVRKAYVADTLLSFASTGIYSNVGDLYKFYQGLRQHKLLPQDWQDLAYAPLKDQHALGWNIEHIFNKQFVVHESGIPGFASLEMWCGQDDVFIVLLENNSGATVSLRTIADNILKNLYGAEPKPVIEKKEEEHAGPPAKGLERYIGEFEFTPDFSLKFTVKDNQLFAESPTMKSILLVAEGPNIFRTTGVAAIVEFIKDKKGNINKAILHQGGQDTPGNRVK